MVFLLFLLFFFFPFLYLSIKKSWSKRPTFPVFFFFKAFFRRKLSKLYLCEKWTKNTKPFRQQDFAHPSCQLSGVIRQVWLGSTFKLPTQRRLVLSRSTFKLCRPSPKPFRPLCSLILKTNCRTSWMRGTFLNSYSWYMPQPKNPFKVN